MNPLLGVPVHIKPTFRAICTQNPSTDEGRKKLAENYRSKCILLGVSSYMIEEIKDIVKLTFERRGVRVSKLQLDMFVTLLPYQSEEPFDDNRKYFSAMSDEQWKARCEQVTLRNFIKLAIRLSHDGSKASEEDHQKWLRIARLHAFMLFPEATETVNISEYFIR